MSRNEEASTRDNIKLELYKKLPGLAKHVLRESAVQFTREPKFSDATLLKLYNIFGATFERGLELYEDSRVTRISASEATHVGISKEKANARWILQVKGFSGEVYTLFPDVNFCPCRAFSYHTRAMTQNTDGYKLVAKLGNLKTVVQLLRSVNFKEVATCFGTENGLKVTVEDAKCIQANVYIPIDVFQEFTLKEEVIFRINLNVLVECLCMFWTNINSQGNTVALQLFYEDTGSPVTVLIEEDGVITNCSLKTQETDELLDFHLEAENVLNKVVLQTELLKDVIAELDPSSDIVELLLSPDPPYFRLTTDGLAGECRVELPHDSDLIDSFECSTKASSCYKLTHIKPAMKPLSCASKVSLRTDNCGLLCFQYVVKTDEGHTCYVEYFISPVIDVDE